MAKNKKAGFFTLFNSVLIFNFLVIAACASIQQPTGGPRDKTPPKVLKETPKNLMLNFKAKKIEIEFDEYFKLSNETKEISISPALPQNPTFKVNKKTLEIEFQDTLERNTTYTINFGKALVDYNEGNVLKNYSYVFATGNVLDSLSISGNVKNFITKKSELETTVLLIPVRQDSIFGKRAASIFTSTDSSGNFTLNNLREDTYRIYALKEKSSDRIFNSTNEEIGFLKDSIVLRKDTANINLALFKEEPAVFKADRKLLNDGRFQFTTNTQLDKPAITILNQPALDKKKIVEYNATGDTILAWLPEMTFDSLDVALLNRGKSIDTVVFRRGKKDTYDTKLVITDNVPDARIRQRRDVIITLSAPIAAADESKITVMEDSLALDAVQLLKDTSSTRKYRLRYNWRNKRSYTLKVEENAFTSILGGKNKVYTKKFQLDPDMNYGDLILTTTVPDSTGAYLVQLLRNENEVLQQTQVEKNRVITYTGLAPGKYAIRVIYDLNKNGKWDTGNVREKRQPEPILNYEKVFTILANRDIEDPLVIPKTP